MKDDETLLEIHRQFTDKEKLAWVLQEFSQMKKKIKALSNENRILKLKNQSLVRQIKEDQIQYPSTMGGETHASVKAYFKLRNQMKKIEERFWEVMQELNKLKGESVDEKIKSNQ